MILDDLCRALEEERDLQRRLVALGEEKRDALVAVDTAGVDAVTRQEQNVLLALGPMAARRMRLTAEAGGSSVSEVARGAGEPYATKLRMLSEELRGVMNNLRRVTTTSRLLAEESLGFVKRFFQIAAGQEEGGYSRRGPSAAGAPPRLLIDEVV